MTDTRLSRLERDRAAAAGGARGHARGAGCRRQSVVGPCRGPGGAPAGRDGARAGRGAGRRRAARRDVHLRRHRGQRAGADAGDRRRPDAPRERLLVSAIEHPSVRAGGRFRPRRRKFPVTADGVVDLDALASRLALAGDARPLVSVMLANNETGVVQPVARGCRARACGRRPPACRCGAGGRAGSLSISRRSAPIFMTLSAHKIGGPQGRRRADQARETLRSSTPLIRGRRAGARRARRHRECARHRRLRRGRGGGGRRLARTRRTDGGAARRGWRRGLQAIAPHAVIFGAMARERGCRTRRCSRFPASRPKPR